MVQAGRNLLVLPNCSVSASPITSPVTVSDPAAAGGDGRGLDCCGAPCGGINRFAGGGGGGNGGHGGGCCLNGAGAGGDSDNLTAPWAYGGAGGRGFWTNVTLISSGTCSSVGLGWTAEMFGCVCRPDGSSPR